MLGRRPVWRGPCTMCALQIRSLHRRQYRYDPRNAMQDPPATTGPAARPAAKPQVAGGTTDAPPRTVLSRLIRPGLDRAECDSHRNDECHRLTRRCLIQIPERKHVATTTTQGVASRRRPRPYVRVEISSRQRLFLGTAGVVGVLAIWQIASSTGILSPTLASSPEQMWQAAVSLTKSGVLGAAALSSAQLFITGFAIAAVAGIILGIVLGWFTRVAAVLNPWVSILYATPRIA